MYKNRALARPNIVPVTTRDSMYVKNMYRVCADICDACAAECDMHKSMKSCKVCADACRVCASECRKMMA